MFVTNKTNKFNLGILPGSEGGQFSHLQAGGHSSGHRNPTAASAQCCELGSQATDGK